MTDPRPAMRLALHALQRANDFLDAEWIDKDEGVKEAITALSTYLAHPTPARRSSDPVPAFMTQQIGG